MEKQSKLQSKKKGLDLINYEGPCLSLIDFDGEYIIKDQWGYICAIFSFPELMSFLKGKTIVTDNKGKKWNWPEHGTDARPTLEAVMKYIGVTTPSDIQKAEDPEKDVYACLLSILDTLKLHDKGALYEEDETLSEMMFRKMEAYGIDLNKKLGYTHLAPVLKNPFIAEKPTHSECVTFESDSYCFEVSRIFKDDGTPYDGVGIEFTDKRDDRDKWETEYWDNTSWMIGVYENDESAWEEAYKSMDENGIKQLQYVIKYVMDLGWIKK